MILEVNVGVAGTKMFPDRRLFHLSDADGERQMVYLVWMLRYANRLVLVDTGFPARVAVEHGIDNHVPTADLLTQAGVSIADVDDVIVSHFHYDHFSAPGDFPRATFHIQRDEIEYWTGRGRDHPVSILSDAASLAELPALIDAGRIHVIDGGVCDIGNGLKLLRVGGHTPGSQITVLDHGDSPVVFACDASHTYDNLARRTPAGSIHNYDEYQRGFATIEALAVGGVWFPGHDSTILDRLDQIGPATFRLGLKNTASMEERS